MSLARCVLISSLVLFLANCTSVSEYLNPQNNIYCDNFLVYDMCVTDTDQDGVAEYVYFADTRDVFLYREDTLSVLPEHLGMHYCARVMNDELVAATSRMLFFDDKTSLIERTNVRSALLLQYMALMPSISECKLAHEQKTLAAENG